MSLHVPPSFLNSGGYGKFQSDLHGEILKTIKLIDGNVMFEFYNFLTQIMELRDQY